MGLFETLHAHPPLHGALSMPNPRQRLVSLQGKLQQQCPRQKSTFGRIRACMLPSGKNFFAFYHSLMFLSNRSTGLIPNFHCCSLLSSLFFIFVISKQTNFLKNMLSDRSVFLLCYGDSRHRAMSSAYRRIHASSPDSVVTWAWAGLAHEHGPWISCLGRSNRKYNAHHGPRTKTNRWC